MARFGSREISDVVLKNLNSDGSPGTPALHLETLTVSSTEVKADSSYARGGPGNPKRIAWDSNKEVNYAMTDALISPEALAILAGTTTATGAVNAHKKEFLTLGTYKTVLTIGAPASKVGTAILTLNGVAYSITTEIDSTADEVAALIGALSIDGFDLAVSTATVTISCNSTFTYSYALGTSEGCTGTFDPVTTPTATVLTAVLAETPIADASTTPRFICNTTAGYDIGTELAVGVAAGNYAIVGKLLTVVTGGATTNNGKLIADYYYTSPATSKRINIDSNKFPGYYWLEASTLWKRETDGEDLPALFTMPKIKLQNNFKISNASSGDPATFDFNSDVFPDANNHMVIIDILEDV